jgi:hypothetical protein
VACLLVALCVAGAGPRPFAVVGGAALLVAVLARRLPRGPAAALLLLAGVLAVGGAAIVRSVPVGVAGALLLAAGAVRGWGCNRERPRRRAWAIRALAAVGSIAVVFLIVYPTLLVVGYLGKPRDAIDDAALGLGHASVRFPASDGVRLAGWWVPSRNGAAVVLVHGGGGDREGAVRHARMLARAGYGVLLYDARGRGESDGDENAFGWEWDRDVRGAVSWLAGRGMRRIGLLGLSTGAEAVVTEAASDPRVGAVVADGLQGRTPADAAHLGTGDRLSVQPPFAVAAAEIRLVRGQRQPRPLLEAVHDVARTRPLLLIGTVAFERAFDRAYTRGTAAQLWELPDTAHTHGLQDRPDEYARRVTTVLGGALLR